MRRRKSSSSSWITTTTDRCSSTTSSSSSRHSKRANIEDELQIKSQKSYLEEMKDWRGSSKSTSEFVAHFIASGTNNGTGYVTIEEAILSVLPRDIDSQGEFVKQQTEDLLRIDNDSIFNHLDAEFRHDPRHFDLHRQLRPVELLALGSIWYLPGDAPKDPGLGAKPARLEVKHLTCPLKPGDYLRVHHTPRRFSEVHRVDWSKRVNESNFEETYPGVIVDENIDKGYLVVNKPAGVPVHATVDNILENVVAAVGRALVSRQRNEWDVNIANNSTDCNQSIGENELPSRKQQNGNHSKKRRKVDPLIYVATPQRLDHNTSGLFVVATKKEFAAYFAKLLRVKTEAHLRTGVSNNNTLGEMTVGNVQKRYRCLVCIQPADGKNKNGLPTSLAEEVERLHRFANDNTIIRHWLEPNFRAPHVYSDEYSKDWLECLLRITRVGKVIPVDDSCELSKLLWSSDGGTMPPQCKAVAELEVELMTGRAHQIRGQLSTMGFPICGDAVYGGVAQCGNTSPPPKDTKKRIIQEQKPRYTNSEQLALQCCELQFPDLDYNINNKGELVPVQSDRIKRFRLETAWWTPFLSIDNGSFSGSTTNFVDLTVASSIRRSASNHSKDQNNHKNKNNEIASIPSVQLSPGANKYVILKATLPGSNEVKWFVKSASTKECGGPYHADVAKALLQDLSCATYDTVVCGGGRIDYNEANKTAHVYGFSYGFGKGDHEYVSLLIEKAGIRATYDNSDFLY